MQSASLIGDIIIVTVTVHFNQGLSRQQNAEASERRTFSGTRLTFVDQAPSAITHAHTHTHSERERERLTDTHMLQCKMARADCVSICDITAAIKAHQCLFKIGWVIFR